MPSPCLWASNVANYCSMGGRLALFSKTERLIFRWEIQLDHILKNDSLRRDSPWSWACLCCSSAAAAASTSETKELFSAVMASSAGEGRHDVVFQCVRSPEAEMYALLHLRKRFYYCLKKSEPRESWRRIEPNTNLTPHVGYMVNSLFVHREVLD